MDTPASPISAQEFVLALEAEVNAALEKSIRGPLAQETMLEGASSEPNIPELLKLALKNEFEATEIAALWMNRVADVDIKLALARQCGDEAKHYRWIESRLKAMGESLSGFSPQGGSPIFDYLSGLIDPAAMIAAGPFAREALAIIRNDVFAEYCDSQGDKETAMLYREHIQPDERHHHMLGCRLLERLAQTDEQREVAREAALKTVRLADEIQEMIRMKRGIRHAPGC